MKMLMRKQADPIYLEDWPEHYYEIRDIDQRELCLKEILKTHPESKEDQLRLDLFMRRFGERANHKPIDSFMRGWMMILVADKSQLTMVNHRRQELDLKHNLSELCVLNCERSPLLEAEWNDFARAWLRTCLTSTSYSSTLFGMMKTSEHSTAMRIAREIDEGTRIIPSRFRLEEECAALHEIMIRCYIEMVEDGQQYWNDYLASPRV
ncbi:MAG: hypothetical protein EOM64_06855 [Erysipelotrichia bacterium]|nr:hypothetical protein [Erysipelotrichia bacterium]